MKRCVLSDQTCLFMPREWCAAFGASHFFHTLVKKLFSCWETVHSYWLFAGACRLWLDRSFFFSLRILFLNLRGPLNPLFLLERLGGVRSRFHSRAPIPTYIFCALFVGDTQCFFIWFVKIPLSFPPLGYLVLPPPPLRTERPLPFL